MPTFKQSPDDVLAAFAASDMYPVGEGPPVRMPGGETPVNQSREMVVPIPPSVNNLFATVRGRRVKSAAYRAWMEQATFALHGHEWQGGYPVKVTMTVCEKVNAQRDLDNFAKPLLDSLVAAGVIRRDSVKFVTDVVLRYRPGTGDGVRIELR